MNKLRLEPQKFTGAEVLSRSQLKKVMGGSGSGYGDVECDRECEGEGECTVQTPAGPFTGICKQIPVVGGCTPDNVNLLCSPAN